MGRKKYFYFSHLLVVILLASLVNLTSPVRAASDNIHPHVWTQNAPQLTPELDVPGYPASANQLTPYSHTLTGIVDIAVAPDGTTIYVVTGDENKLYKSTDGGLTWTLKMVAPTGVVTLDLAAVAPDDANTVAVVDKTSKKIYVSTDGAASFAEVTGLSIGDMNDLAISSLTDSIRNVAVAGNDGAGYAQLSYYALGGAVPGWRNAASWNMTDSTPLAAITRDVNTIAFSPNFASDKVLLAVTKTPSGEARLDIASFSTQCWDNAGGFAGYPAMITAGAGDILHASIALAPTYLGPDSSSRVAFIGLKPANFVTRLYRFNDTVKLEMPSGGLWSVAYNGLWLSAGAADSNTVFYSNDMLALTPTIHQVDQYQCPSGTAGTTYPVGETYPTKTVVAITGTSNNSSVVAGTSGRNNAFSISRDHGVTFNDVSLIDAAFTSIDDFAVSENGDTEYLITYYYQPYNYRWSSLWRKKGTWERLLTMVGTGYHVRTDSSGSTVYVFQPGSAGLFYSNDSGEKSISYRDAVAPVNDLEVESHDVAYVLWSSGAMVYKYNSNTQTWGSGVATWLIGAANLKLVSPGQLLVGSTDGYLSYSTDGNSSWTRIPYQVSQGPGNVQATADTLATGGHIYAATSLAGSKIYRWNIGASTSWESMRDTTIPYGATGIALREGALYVLASDGTSSGLWRTFYPLTATSDSAWGFSLYNGMVFTVSPRALWSSYGPKLWAINRAIPALESAVEAMTLPPTRQSLAIYRSGGTWFIDTNRSGGFDSGADWINMPGLFGKGLGDIPLVVDWNGDGTQEMAIYRPGGTWFIDLNHNGTYDPSFDWTNSPNLFGKSNGDVPLAVDWDGDGQQELAIYRPGGTWFIDLNHNGTYDPGFDWTNSPNLFGKSNGDVPLAVDWDEDGRQELAIYRPGGTWFIDLNHNGGYDPGVDWTNSPNLFGKVSGDVPLAIDWDGDGIQELAIFRPSTATWFIDLNHNGTFDPGIDLQLGAFGKSTGDIPLAVKGW